MAVEQPKPLNTFFTPQNLSAAGIDVVDLGIQDGIDAGDFFFKGSVKIERVELGEMLVSMWLTHSDSLLAQYHFVDDIQFFQHALTYFGEQVTNKAKYIQTHALNQPTEYERAAQTADQICNAALYLSRYTDWPDDAAPEPMCITARLLRGQ